GWGVEVGSGGERGLGACAGDGDGPFVLPDQPAGMHTVLLRHQDEHVELPVVIATSVLPDSGELLLTYDAAAAAGQLQIEPVLPDGVHDVYVEVRAWQEQTGRGTANWQRVANAPAYTLGGLPAGWYRVEVGALRLGWSDA